ncbi:nucleosome-remodeling factor subunit BPTF [Hylobates moloch]|uniref:nucleosome-remodeling factor subunit BPTF n=1 Tax=Hylobates moloch TaxID=81572 RepID=UPI0026774AAF|nr:nucleosome-remodeling factor subunit BPTF [Hylobates moloch]
MQLLHVPISRHLPSVPARTPTTLARTYLSFAVEKREPSLKPTSRCYREEDTENENENKIWYYSTKVQLAELIDCLDEDYWEAELCKILEEMREEIHRHINITEDLTDKVRGSNPFWQQLMVLKTYKP